MEPATRAKGPTSRHHGRSEIDQSSKTESYQAGKNSIKELQKENTIIILPTDKAKPTVVMEKKEYQNNMSNAE